MFYFYVHEDDKAKCSWLKLVKSCGSEEEHNIVAHTVGSDEVCYEAIRDIPAGEVLVALYDETYGNAYSFAVKLNLSGMGKGTFDVNILYIL